MTYSIKTPNGRLSGSIQELLVPFGEILARGNEKNKSVNPSPKTLKGLINNINRAYRVLGYPCRQITISYD